MLILHIVAPCDVGGLERVVQGLACEQRQSGHDVHVAVVLTGQDADHPFFAPLTEAGVETHTVMPGVRGYGRERGAVAELCRRLRPSVVHTHGYRPDVVDANVARHIGIPVVTTVHGFTGGDWKNRLYEWLQARAFRRFDAVVAVSRPLKAQLVLTGVREERIHVVPNAWRALGPALDRTAARRALGLESDAFVVGWVGRLTPEKGADVLLDALSLAPNLPIVAAIVGDGTEREALVAMARRLGLDARVRWLGAVPDAAARFTAFDLFVLSSRTEGSPMVLFEAMAAGVPIIATAVGGVPDTVSPDEAVVIPPAQPGALADAIRTVYHARATARTRAARARARLCRDFGTERWCDRYDAVYRAVTGGSLVPVPS